MEAVKEEQAAAEEEGSAIVVTGLRKSFRVGETDIPVLHGIDLSIEKGDFAMLVGPSGCGKSTLLHIIYGLEGPTEGTVFVKGRDIWRETKDWRAHFRNQQIGFIPQQPFWIKSLKVIENIAIPAVIAGQPFHVAVKRAAKLIELVGMEKWANYRPYDLSGGQQQRIAIARALLLNPIFIIADEPTGNLDQKAGEELLELIRDINKQFGMTTIMVTHNPTQYRFASRIVSMLDGRIVADEQNDGSGNFKATFLAEHGNTERV